MVFLQLILCTVHAGQVSILQLPQDHQYRIPQTNHLSLYNTVRSSSASTSWFKLSLSHSQMHMSSPISNPQSTTRNILFSPPISLFFHLSHTHPSIYSNLLPTSSSAPPPKIPSHYHLLKKRIIIQTRDSPTPHLSPSVPLTPSPSPSNSGVNLFHHPPTHIFGCNRTLPALRVYAFFVEEFFHEV